MRLVPFLTCLALLGPAASPATASSRTDQVRGIVLSTHTDGSDWGSPGVRSTLADIHALGAGWISIHPYGWIDEDGGIRFRRYDPADPPEHLARPIREAHELGLSILIQPHVGTWGSSFSWPGEIVFTSEAQWRRFFDAYDAWITNLVQTCADADAFVLGTELDRTTAHESDWRELIGRVRGLTTVPLTYAANWTHYREVPFWDALDVIGIQAYFPVAESVDAPEPALRAGWDRVIREVREYGDSQYRKVVFTELGYNRSFTAAVRPWEYHTDGPEAEAVQARCLRVALEATEQEPVIVGVFLWKWFPNPHPTGRNFQLATPVLKGVIREAWGP